MRTIARLPAGPASLAAVCLGVLAAPSAYAQDSEALQLSPSIAAPGATVTVNTTACGQGGHGDGDAESLGADEFDLAPGPARRWRSGSSRSRTAPGRGTTRSTCCATTEKRPPETSWCRPTGSPSGHVNSGVGGSVGPDTTQIAAGVAVLAAAAAGGTLLLRRRASGAQG